LIPWARITLATRFSLARTPLCSSARCTRGLP
jgi:hypothetical protein